MKCACETALTPTLSRKPSPVRIYSVSDSSRRVAGCADSQIFACARHVRNLLPYRLTFRFVVILRLRFRVLVTGSPLDVAKSSGQARTGLYAYTGAADRGDRNHARDPETAPKRMRREAIEADSQARARIVQRTETVRSRKFSPQRLGILCPGSRRVPGTRGIASQDLPKNLTLLKKAALQRMRIRLPKNLTVTAAVSKMSMPSDT